MLLDLWRRDIKCCLARKLFVMGLSISLTSSYITGLPHADFATVNNNNNFNYTNNNNNTNSSHHYYQNRVNNNTTINNNRTSHSVFHNNNNDKTPSKINACGTRLKLEIKSICASQKNSQLVNQQKHHFNPQSNGNGLSERRPVIIEPSINEIRQRRGSSESSKLIRVPRGVIQECCWRPCHRSSLLKYCSNYESTSWKASTLAPSIFDPSSSWSSSSVESENEDNEIRKEESKVEQTIHSEPSGILPLILQILWNWGESKEKPFSTNVMNYHPQKLFKLVRTGNHRFQQDRTETNDNNYGGRIRSISERNIDQNQNRWKARRQPPASDETRRDLTSEMSTSDFQDNDDFNNNNNIQKHKNNDNNNESNISNDNNNNNSDSSKREKSVPSETDTKPVKTLATTVTDELHPEIFAMPDYYG